MNLIPISTLFIGISGIIALVLSFIVAIERIKTRVWHGESKQDTAMQPNYLDKPTAWVTFVESMTQKFVVTKTEADGILQRKVRAYANFAEYVPLSLLLLVALELMRSPTWLLWFLGVTLTLARTTHAWGLIKVYGPSPGRAIGFFGTLFVYIIGSLACIYYSIQSFI